MMNVLFLCILYLISFPACPKLSEDTPHKLALDNFRIYRRFKQNCIVLFTMATSKCSACIALDAKKEKEADEKRAQKEKEKNRLQELYASKFHIPWAFVVFF